MDEFYEDEADELFHYLVISELANDDRGDDESANGDHGCFNSLLLMAALTWFLI